jgi:hypothetical protein
VLIYSHREICQRVFKVFGISSEELKSSKKLDENDKNSSKKLDLLINFDALEKEFLGTQMAFEMLSR